ncbi:Prefoldin subunit 3 [Symbiodinium microadriaticum]|uniref:Prefoldin subunit 3 n=1 Tax=Symbiodinium microadriaticum TaxID=2951 RepID=A0A1Q9CZN9_SYMMI|nr:Prefoldin subunit 3 [Symbiodinium microadriaticum]
MYVVEHLVSKSSEASEDEPTEYTYQLAENIWSKASAPPSKTVCLWLGANCMLEYTLDEALDLLKTNENNARTTLSSLEEDMAFLRDQITTTEVNIARTHNYGVKLRQAAKAKEAGKS